MKVYLLGIDCQYDFCNPNGKLFVKGADQDMIRLASMIKRLSKKIDAIYMTLDSHMEVHIAHPIFWVNSQGNHPNPFTLITEEDVINGTWKAFNPEFQSRAIEYVKTLKANGRYVLCIWPPHCIIGTKGCGFTDEIADALDFWNWENTNGDRVTCISKGTNIFTEHYSAIKADVVDDCDPSTMLNTNLINSLNEADIIAVAGEALSHCVANTVTDLCNSFGEENIKKLVLLEDATSNVPGFENLGKDFITNMTKRGMKLSKTTDFLA
jgi:nicotinamidase-related amidase